MSNTNGTQVRINFNSPQELNNSIKSLMLNILHNLILLACQNSIIYQRDILFKKPERNYEDLHTESEVKSEIAISTRKVEITIT